jgi:hypothetical protein
MQLSHTTAHSPWGWIGKLQAKFDFSISRLMRDWKLEKVKLKARMQPKAKMGRLSWNPEAPPQAGGQIKKTKHQGVKVRSCRTVKLKGEDHSGKINPWKGSASCSTQPVIPPTR